MQYGVGYHLQGVLLQHHALCSAAVELNLALNPLRVGAAAITAFNPPNITPLSWASPDSSHALGSAKTSIRITQF